METNILKKLIKRADKPERVEITPERALRQAIPKAAEAQFGIIFDVTEVDESVQQVSELVEQMHSEPLIAFLRARDGAVGLISMDAQTVAALVEVQITGEISPHPAEERGASAVDAALCSSFVDTVFEQLEILLSAEGRGPWFYGYRMGGRIEAARKIGLRIEEGAYLMYTLELGLSDRERSGKMMIALPSHVRNTGANGSVAPDTEDWSAALATSVMGSNADLSAVLHRIRLPIADVSAISVGQLVPIPRDSINKVQVLTLDGKTAMIGRLGQAQGFRAIRLMSEVDSAVFELTDHGANALPTS